MSRYAESTRVPSDRSRSEIEKTLMRYGACRFMYGWESTTAVVAFEMCSRHVRFDLHMPNRGDDEFTRTPTGRDRSSSQAALSYDQAVRQRWRALHLVIKAKLEAVESGITEFEDEFMSHIILPDGRTVGRWMRPQIEKSYALGGMPLLLPTRNI